MTISIPGAPRPPKGGMDCLKGTTLWIYGEPKIGKTTFASNLPGAWFIDTQFGQEFVEVRPPTTVATWQEFRELAMFLLKEKPTKFSDGADIEWLVIDMLGDLFQLCFNDVTKSLGLEDPSELGHGKGWTRLNNEWVKVMNAIQTLPYGICLLDHSRTTKQKIGGVERDRTDANIGAAGNRWALRRSDLIIYMFARAVPEKNEKNEPTGKILQKRFMGLHPSEAYVAGGRMSNLLPPVLPLGWDHLVAALTPSDSKGEQE